MHFPFWSVIISTGRPSRGGRSTLGAFRLFIFVCLALPCDSARCIRLSCTNHVWASSPAAKLCHEQDYNYHFLHVRFLLIASLPVRLPELLSSGQLLCSRFCLLVRIRLELFRIRQTGLINSNLFPLTFFLLLSFLYPPVSDLLSRFYGYNISLIFVIVNIRITNIWEYFKLTFLYLQSTII